MAAPSVSKRLLEFQSSPAPKSGCYAFIPDDALQEFVSILTRSKERVLHFGDGANLSNRIVSILTRSKERVLRHITGGEADGFRFQSSPAPKSGCYSAARKADGHEKFQSSPAPKSGCYCHPQMATKNKCLYPFFRESGFCMLEQSIISRNTSTNSLIFFIRESCGILAGAPGPRYTISGSSKKTVRFKP